MPWAGSQKRGGIKGFDYNATGFSYKTITKCHRNQVHFKIHGTDSTRGVIHDH